MDRIVRKDTKSSQRKDSLKTVFRMYQMIFTPNSKGT